MRYIDRLYANLGGFGGDDFKITDRERALWVDNDEGLYDLWKSSKLSKRDFIREYRITIDSVIRNVTSGRKRAHYLVYDKPKKGPLNGLGSDVNTPWDDERYVRVSGRCSVVMRIVETRSWADVIATVFKDRVALGTYRIHLPQGFAIDSDQAIDYAASNALAQAESEDLIDIGNDVEVEESGFIAVKKPWGGGGPVLSGVSRRVRRRR